MSGGDHRIRAGLQWLGRIADRFARDDPGSAGHFIGRFVVLRLLGLVYLMAFLTLVNQGPGLIGAHGLLPATRYLDAIAAELGGRGAAFVQLPSLFWLGASDAAIAAAGWTGVVLSLLVLAGYANALILGVLCALQISVLVIGQDFYGFGWETQLAETGFLCIFLCPLVDGRPFSRRPPPAIIVWLLRWLIVRVMWGAGLIKLRGDTCWRDLSCLDFHFETQPIPSPLTPLFHFLPALAHKLGVLFNHVVELAAPLFVFGPRRVRYAAGIAMAALQIVLLASGNLSFLNWLTLVPILACFDDHFWARVLPAALVARAARARAAATPSRAQGAAAAMVALAVLVLSVAPVLNLVSGTQMMNTSFTRLPLVNTYGAFGSVGRERNELVIEGTTDAELTADTRWQAYDFKCKPGDPARRPCWMSPYHYRVDWLLWFAAMGRPRDYPWAVHLVWKLLSADRATLGLLAHDPFGGTPPRHVRVELYRYRLAPRGARAWWQRERIGEWLPAVSLGNAELRTYLDAQGFLRRD